MRALWSQSWAKLLRMKNWVPCIVPLLVVLVQTEPANAGEAFMLITEEEAAMEMSPLRGRKDLSDGPSIRIESPDISSELFSPFPIHIVFAKGENGLAPDSKTLNITYLKAWGVNITSRVKKFLKDDTIYLPKADIPKGRHSIEVYIEDEQSNPSSRTVTFTVSKKKKSK